MRMVSVVLPGRDGVQVNSESEVLFGGSTISCVSAASPSTSREMTVWTSCGIALRMVNGTCRALPATAKVGASIDTTSMSGCATGLPAQAPKIGTLRRRYCIAVATGEPPSFQSPSLNSTTARRYSWWSSRSCKGPARLVLTPPAACSAGVPVAADTGWITTSAVVRRRSQVVPCTSRATCSARVIGGAAGSLALITSRVRMLPESSHSTATTGFSFGFSWNTHSGWLRVNSTADTITKRSTSSAPVLSIRPLRSQAATHRPAVSSSTAHENTSDVVVGRMRKAPSITSAPFRPCRPGTASPHPRAPEP
jgi:hypothetical protein